jgi:transcriptional regulator with XRE-family HTH domain
MASPRHVTPRPGCGRSGEPGSIDGPSFGALLRRHRVAAGLSQEALAERAHLSVRAVNSLERGDRQAPYRATVEALVRVLDLTGAERAAFEAAASRSRGPRVATSPAPTAALAPLPLSGRAS